MNQIRFNELNLFAQELRACLSPEVLQEIVKRVGFVKRKSKYQANELIALCVWMIAEGLNQRFNAAAVAYLREVFRTLLAQKLCAPEYVMRSI